MTEYKRKYQYLSKLVEALPEKVSRVRYIACFQEAIRTGDITAVPLGSSFKVGRHTYKEDLVREGPEFDTWHERAVRSLELYRERRGVAVDEIDVLNETVDYDELAARYRQQLVGRASVKRSKRQTKRGKPKLTPSQPHERLTSPPASVSEGDTGAPAGVQIAGSEEQVTVNA